MTYSPLNSVKEFHKAFGATPFVELSDHDARQDFLALRHNLIQEEWEEVAVEMCFALEGEGNLVNLAKELADLLYVVYGTADLLEIPLDEVFNAVHTSNMSKLGPDGKPIYREDGKFLKGPNYHPADISAIVTGSI